jgi:hypothetical protein
MKKVELDLNKINIDRLRMLDEDTLRKNVLIPLLKYIEAQNVTDMHGSNEEGIDIYFEALDIFGNRLRLGIQVKNKNLVYTANSSNENLNTILNQIQMAFSKRIRVMTSDRSGEVYLDGFYVITSGRITQAAIDHIYENKSRYPNIQLINGERLMEIIKNKNLLKQRKIEIPIGSPKAIFEVPISPGDNP